MMDPYAEVRFENRIAIIMICAVVVVGLLAPWWFGS